VVFDSSGSNLGADYSHWNNIHLTLQGKYGARASRSDPADENTSTLHVSAPILEKMNLIGVMTVAKPTRSLVAFIKNARMQVFFHSLYIFFGTLALAFLFIRFLTRPIERITRYIRKSKTSRAAAFPKLPDDEIGNLGRELKGLQDDLEGKKYIERYVQTLTHELKSPISAIRGAAELLEGSIADKAKGRLLQNISTESERIADIIERLLLLASLENRKSLEKKEEVPMAALFQDVLKSFEPQLLKNEIVVSFEKSDTAVILGDSFILHHAFANLMQNAVNHSPQNGLISVRLEKTKTGFLVAVSDRGPGIPAFALPRIFEKFYSLENPGTGKKGSGLGLSFAKEAMELHGGRVEVVNRAGGGATASLYFSLQT
ncbi:MAG: two-component system sensor histidine kinase CreC, partial [Spirochaetia bacterium]|nr:two-component system sensor histidine kinase CreC [Spirochaetia bacterium]